MECVHCKSVFKNKSSLNNHQKRAKYCLDLQGLNNCSEFVCTCGKEYTSKENFEYHQKKCHVYISQKVVDIKDEKIAELLLQIQQRDQQIRDLQEKLKDIAIQAVSRPFDEEAAIEIEPEENSDEEEYQLTPLDLGEGQVIEYREEDGYINVTNLCKAGGKKFAGWKRLEKTKAFLRELSTAVQIHTSVLIQVGSGSKFGTTQNTETWVHPQVAINIAQWISPQFDVKVSAWVYEVMMTGKVDITNTKSYRQLQQENKDKQLRIRFLEKKYVKKQLREKIEDSNVIYILTTKNLKKERRYILGKATNLTNRLSTYNKTDEHEVVYYQKCPSEDSMSTVESMIFEKLKHHREQANRERFILPDNANIDMFIDTVKKCIEFVS